MNKTLLSIFMCLALISAQVQAYTVPWQAQCTPGSTGVTITTTNTNTIVTQINGVASMPAQAGFPYYNGSSEFTLVNSNNIPVTDTNNPTIMFAVMVFYSDNFYVNPSTETGSITATNVPPGTYTLYVSQASYAQPTNVTESYYLNGTFTITATPSPTPTPTPTPGPTPSPTATPSPSATPSSSATPDPSAGSSDIAAAIAGLQTSSNAAAAAVAEYQAANAQTVSSLNSSINSAKKQATQQAWLALIIGGSIGLLGAGVAYGLTLDPVIDLSAITKDDPAAAGDVIIGPVKDR